MAMLSHFGVVIYSLLQTELFKKPLFLLIESSRESRSEIEMMSWQKNKSREKKI